MDALGSVLKKSEVGTDNPTHLRHKSEEAGRLSFGVVLIYYEYACVSSYFRSAGQAGSDVIARHALTDKRATQCVRHAAIHTPETVSDVVDRGV